MTDMDRRSHVMAMLAAWLNCHVGEIPPENTSHLNANTMAAWERVYDAAIQSERERAKVLVDALRGVVSGDLQSDSHTLNYAAVKSIAREALAQWEVGQ